MHNFSNIEVGCCLAVRAPCAKSFTRVAVTCGKKSIGSNNACKALGELRNESKSDEPAPVLAYQGEIVELVCGEPLGHPVNMTLIGVVGHCGGFVAAAKAHEVGGNHAVPSGGKDGNHFAVEVTPGGLTVHAQDGFGGGVSCAGALIYMVHA